MRTNSTDRLREMRTKGGGGVENPKNFADVLYVWSLTSISAPWLGRTRATVTSTVWSKKVPAKVGEESSVMALAALGYWVGGRREIQTCRYFFAPHCNLFTAVG